VPSVLAVEGTDYSIYLADGRESEDPGAGEPIQGEMILGLPEGGYESAWYTPVTGGYSEWSILQGGENTRIALPEFRHDVVYQVRRR
jgi:hypothetical protein